MGVGGTIRAAAKLCNDLAGDDPENRDIPAGEIFDLYRTLKKGGSGGPAADPALRPRPGAHHPPGLIVLKTVLKAFDVTSVSVSRYGVAEGYLIKRVLRKRAIPMEETKREQIDTRYTQERELSWLKFDERGDGGGLGTTRCPCLSG